MTISDLIAKLEAIQSAHGDLPVFHAYQDDWQDEEMLIDRVAIHEGQNVRRDIPPPPWQTTRPAHYIVETLISPKAVILSGAKTHLETTRRFMRLDDRFAADPTEIAPCVDCEAVAEVRQHERGNFYVHCSVCPCHLAVRADMTPAQAVESWNNWEAPRRQAQWERKTRAL